LVNVPVTLREPLFGSPTAESQLSAGGVPPSTLAMFPVPLVPRAQPCLVVSNVYQSAAFVVPPSVFEPAAPPEPVVPEEPPEPVVPEEPPEPVVPDAPAAPPVPVLPAAPAAPPVPVPPAPPPPVPPVPPQLPSSQKLSM